MNNSFQVANSLSAYLEEISLRADELIASGDIDALVDVMTTRDACRFRKALGVICRNNISISLESVALLDIRKLIYMAASKLAERQYKQETDAAAEAIAERFLHNRKEET